MNPRHHASLHLLILALGAALSPDAAVADTSSTIPTYQTGAGALSYTFFNLSGSDCTLNAYGSGGNPAAYSEWAQAVGWGNDGNAGFFNPIGLNFVQVNSNYLFYNNYDPINGTTIPTGNISLNTGTSYNALITSGVLGPVSGNESINYPSMGDSWSIACQNGTPPIAVASLASAASALQSNGPTSYPYTSSQPGWFENAAINPPAWAGCNSSTNPCGVGFTAPTNGTGNLVLNWNVPSSAANYQAMGGLWSGINYNSTSDTYPASMALNQAMLPINLSAYVAANQGNFNPNNASQVMSYTTAYGGHYTLALGDPFIISSYAAKMLWFQVISESLTLNDGTDLSSISSTLSNTANTGVFESRSFEDNYVQWLLGSQASSQNYTGAPQLAASAYQSVFKAASVPITEETTWGYVWTAIADTVVNAAVVGAALIPGAGWGLVGVIALGGALVTGDGAATPDMNAAIANAHTVTLSGPPPLSQAAPAIINPTEVASTTLLGLWLTNTFVQAQINGNNGGPSPFTSNYSINTDNQTCLEISAYFGYTQCNPLNTDIGYINNGYTVNYLGPFGCTNLQLANNLLSGSCWPNNDWLSGQVSNGPNSNVPNGYYVNVYAQAQTSTQFSIWDAILTGSDVTTDSNGYIVMGGNAGNVPSFSPPVQMINATSGSAAPTAPLPAGLSVNTTFNLNTGTLTATGYTTTTPGDPTAAGPNPAPSAMPSINVVISGANPADAIYALSGGGLAPNYDSSSGVLEIGYYSANGTVYTFANGAQSINMTGCAPNSTVTLTITPDATNASNAWGASGALACSLASTASLGSGMGVALDYKLCVNDHWATGGVVAAFTSAPNSATGEGGAVTLACACVPAYLDGPSNSRASSSQLLGGVIVGATSSNSQQCPTPYD